MENLQLINISEIHTFLSECIEELKSDGSFRENSDPLMVYLIALSKIAKRENERYLVISQVPDGTQGNWVIRMEVSEFPTNDNVLLTFTKEGYFTNKIQWKKSFILRLDEETSTILSLFKEKEIVATLNSDECEDLESVEEEV